MSKLVLNDEQKSNLNGMKEPVEVWQADGKLVGQLVPQALYVQFVYAWAKAEATKEDLDRARKSGTGRSLAAILGERGQK